MNLKHLGDAFDHWKGSVMRRIGSRSLRVLPMFTDKKEWTPRQLSTYAKLLHRKPGDILKQKETFSRKAGKRYFENLGIQDLFLDPDTGIGPEKSATVKHVKPSEVACLLSKVPKRVLLIYQHKWQRKSMKDTLKRVLSIEGVRKFHGFAYNADQVAMVFISRDQERIAKASKRLRSWLGPIALTRLFNDQ